MIQLQSLGWRCRLRSTAVPVRGGFTLAEVVVAVALIAIVFGSTVWALTGVNTVASKARNYTGAYTAALKQIDAILSVGPFNPQQGQIPPELTPGTTTTNNVAIYNDPPVVGGVLQILTLGAQPTFSGSMTTTVADVSPTPNAPPYIYRATVTVSWTYRSRNYSFSMSTLRTSDI